LAIKLFDIFFKSLCLVICGVSQRSDEDTSLLISKADQLLLKAKKNDKNKIES